MSSINFKCFILIFIGIHYLTTSICAKKIRYLNYESILYKYNSKHIAYFQVNTSSSMQTVDARLDMEKATVGDIWVELIVNMKPPQLNLYRRILQFKMNVCDMFRYSKTEGFNVFKVWTNNLRESGNMPMECPVKKGQYTWHIAANCKVNVLQLEGNYRTTANVYYKLKNSVDSILNFTAIMNVFYK